MTAESKNRRGMSLRTLSTVMIAVSAFVSFLLFFSVTRVSRGYEAMRTATDTYIRTQQDVSDLQAGSDYLTEQVRSYVITGDQLSMNQYFEEAEVTRRRDAAVESLETVLDGTEACTSLQTAMQYSNDLMEIEYRAFLLRLAADHVPHGSYPVSLQNVSLSAQDSALSDAEKKELAEQLVFDDAYRSCKNRISEQVRKCMVELAATTQTEQSTTMNQLRTALTVQYILIALLLAIVFAVILIMTFHVINPLLRSIRRIQGQEYLEPKGLAEMQFLAGAYNDMFAKVRTDQEKLSYEATHDALTGLYNRKAYEQVMSDLEKLDICYLMLDVDNFKGVNDTYGHDTGDRVLRRVAQLLKENFRSDDMAFRFGGDEFAVVMRHMNPALRDLVSAKVTKIREELARETDGIPAVTLSTGAAFSGCAESTGSVAKDADIALYEVKKTGKGGIEFYPVK